jgi:hypothetical protein
MQDLLKTPCIISNEEACKALDKAIRARKVGSTLRNVASSRSHAVVVFNVKRILPEGQILSGSLNIIDLAGSEFEGAFSALKFSFGIPIGKLIDSSRMKKIGPNNDHKRIEDEKLNFSSTQFGA